jgi:hypothetical protein
MPGYPAEFWRAKRVDGLLELFGIAGQARRLILLERAARGMTITLTSHISPRSSFFATGSSC